MYFPIGWPKVLKGFGIENQTILQIISNRDKVLFAVLTPDTLVIWFCKPCVPIVYHKRNDESIGRLGINVSIEWKPDSSMLCISTAEGHLIFYDVDVIPGQPTAYQQCDPPSASLRRDSAELFVKEVIPPLRLVLSKEILVWDGQITRLSCISGTELMVCTTKAHLLRYRWDGTQNRDYCLDLRRIPFCINQQVSKAIPIVEDNTHVSDIEYSPLVGGFGITLNDGRAAFLTATTLKFDPNQVQGIWAPGIDDATCASVNHKYRLIAFGRKNSQVSVYTIDETTGGLETSHNLVLSSKDFPGDPGSVKCTRWTGDGRAVAVSWSGGGVSVWSTFGGLLMCSLAWDYGLNQDLLNSNPLDVSSMEWCTEGYQLWMVKINKKEGERATSLVQLDFVKSPLSVNPCMNQQSHLYLQADDRLYVNLGDNLTKSNTSDHHNDHLNNNADKDSLYSIKDDHIIAYKCNPIDEVPLSPKMQAEGKQWIVLPLPATYSATNWPIRYSAIDTSGFNLAVAGRTGIAHYNMLTRKWKLFGNESQEKDFVVTGGMLWWNDYIIVGSFSILDGYDELRFYPRESKLDNRFAKIFGVPAQVLLIDILEDQLVVFGSDALVQIYDLKFIDNVGGIELQCIQAVDVSALCVHPACVVSVGLSRLGHEAFRPPSHTQASHYTHPNHHIRQRAREQKQAHSMILNVSGRLMMVQREESDHDDDNSNTSYLCLPATVLASCVELAWACRRLTASQPQLTRALWLWCGAAGCRVWLPLFAATDHQHTFMSKRIMLPFHLNIYPLAILFEDAILLGAENDTLLYSSDSKSAFSLPFCVINRTSQVYLHQILRQLLRRNLGYHAWEIARSCSNLPYFPHSLELLLHEVLEEEATSKEPIPDAQLPSVIEFIQEFPVYLQTVVQCARKTEIALWAYLFSAAGKPKELFQECLQRKMLDTAASYLIILQNLESSAVSRQLATVLLDTALQLGRWDLARDLVRFLRAIEMKRLISGSGKVLFDPNDVDSPRNSVILANKLNNPTAAPVSPNAEDLSVILGSMQASRCRSFSTTANPAGSGNANAGAGGEGAIGGSGGGTEGQAGRATPPATAAPNLATATVKRKKSVPTARADKEAIRESSTAEEFFIDVMLQRHARRLLASASLQQLGRFASALDFHLVVWLGGERERAARVDSAVTCLRRLHDDFCWPYPVPQHPIDTVTGRKTSLAVPSSPSPGDTDSLFGDSGYVSLPLIHSFPIASSALSDAASVCEAGSAWGGDALVGPVSPTGAGPSSGGPTEERRYAALMERLSHQQAEKGSPRAEVQLRYLLQLMTEAGCLEWSLLISVVLRDAMAVLRTTNAARSSDISIDAVSRLRRALQSLCSWADTECIGYKPFMMAVNNQISFLTTVLVNREKQQMMFKPRLSQASIVTTIPEIAPIKQPTVKNVVNQTAVNEAVKIQQRKESPQSTTNNVHLNNNNVKVQKVEETGSNCVVQ